MSSKFGCVLANDSHAHRCLGRKCIEVGTSAAREAHIVRDGRPYDERKWVQSILRPKEHGQASFAKPV